MMTIRNVSAAARGVMLLAVVLTAIGVAGVAAGADAVDAGLVARWQLTADKLSGQSFAPLAGKLPAAANQPVKFSGDSPRALRLAVVTKNKVKTGQFLTVADDLPAARLPTREITVEAWVQVGKPDKLGGFACAVQEGKSVNRGWVLGNSGNRFSSPSRQPRQAS